MKNKKNIVVKYFFLAIAILMNGFIIAYSCLSMETTMKWNWFITNLFSGVVNTITEKEVEVIPVTEVNVFLSGEESYVYNYLPGYKVDEIPLGSAKQIECQILPDNASDKSIQYYTDNNNIVSLSRNGNLLSVVGLKTGTATIHAKNNLSGVESTCEVKVIDTIAPKYFDATLKNSTIQIGSQETIGVSIDGGHLGTDELINFRYYDTRKLLYTSSNNNILTIDNYGVIHPAGVGVTQVTISNGELSKNFDVHIVDGTMPEPYVNLKIGGSDFCYGNDMLKDQTTHSNHYQLTISDGNNNLNCEDFIWESSDELLLKIDKHGVMRGFRKQIIEDETVIITATSKITGQSVSKEIIIKEQLPDALYCRVNYGGNTTWNPTALSACIGDTVKIDIILEPNVSNKNVTITLSNPEILECTNAGSYFTVYIKGEGECVVSVQSVANPSLIRHISFTFIKAGAIATEDLSDVGFSLRKVLGHAFVFAVAQVFTFLAFYSFIRKKKLLLSFIFSFITQLLFASISEIIERNIPGRSGTFKDVCIDMAGAIVALSIIGCVFLIGWFIKRKKIKDVN